MPKLIPVYSKGTLTAALSKTATTIVMSSGDGALFPNSTITNFSYAVLYKTIDGEEVGHEIVKIVGKSGDILYVNRHQNNTVANTYSIGDSVELMVTKDTIGTSTGQQPNKFKAFAFIRSAIVPETPVGGSYSNPIPETIGWSDSIQTGVDPIYSSTRTFTSDGVGQDNTWTTPALFAQNGTNGEAYLVIIESSNGTEFRVGENQTSTLKAMVFKNGVDVTDSFDSSQFRWRRVSINNQAPPNDDATWNASYVSGYKQIIINVDDVDSRASFFCDIINP
jgi:hypothetical protein